MEEKQEEDLAKTESNGGRVDLKKPWPSIENKAVTSMGLQSAYLWLACVQCAPVGWFLLMLCGGFMCDEKFVALALGYIYLKN